MRRPNFFVIGAPKCGTTSLADWLRQNPQVFVSTPKEPCYFSPDISLDKYHTLDAYERLFLDAGEEHVAIGEASPSYLRSKVAVPKILQYQPQARFIVMLRSPIELAISDHGQLVYTFNEDIEDFETAWRAQEDRRNGNRIPKRCLHPGSLLYGEANRLGEQLERLYSIVSRERVHVIFLEDMKNDPARVYRRVAEFLGVNARHHLDFVPSNQRKTHRIRLPARILRNLSDLRRSLGIPPTGLLRVPYQVEQKINRMRAVTPHINEALRNEMLAYFEDDIRKLERLTGRQLGHWLS